MSKRYRSERIALAALAVIVLGAVLVSAFGLLEQVQRQACENPAYACDTASNDEPYNGWRDTYAQWGMMMFALFGVVVGIWTILLLRKNNRISKRAARDQLLETRRIGEAQIRAYLAIGPIELATHPPERNILQVRVAIQNQGQTTARNTVSEFCAAVTTGEWEAGQLLPRPKPMPRPSRSNMPAGYRAQVGVQTPPVAQFDDVYAALQRGEVEFYVWGWVQYEDVFGVQHETTFQWFLDKPALLLGIGFRSDEIGNAET